jgi:hypothetical protein
MKHLALAGHRRLVQSMIYGRRRVIEVFGARLANNAAIRKSKTMIVLA